MNCEEYYHISPEVANIAVLNDLYVDQQVISAGPLELISHVVTGKEDSDVTIFHMAVPASWGLTVYDIQFYAILIAVLLLFYLVLVPIGWYWLKSRQDIPIDKRTVRDQMHYDEERRLDDEEQMKYIREWDERKKRKYREDTMEMRRRRDERWYNRLKHLFKPGGSIDREE